MIGKMRIKKLLSKIYWKTKFTIRDLKKRRKTESSYRKLLRDNKKSPYANMDWNYLIIDRRLDGGAAKYLNEKLDNVEEFQSGSVVVRFQDRILGYAVEFIRDQGRVKYSIPSYEELTCFLSGFRVKKIYVNELFAYDNLYEMLEYLMELKEQKACQLIYLLHDYYCICPVSNLTTKTMGYCALKYDCMQCLQETEHFNSKIHGDIYEWRRRWETFLGKCDTIIAFSQDTKNRISQVYRELSIQVIPHQNYNRLRKVHPLKKEKKELVVGILGMLSTIKGLQIVKEMIEYVNTNRLPVRFVLVGDIWGDGIEASETFCKTGRYTRDELPDIVERHQIDMVLIASVVPETFSYTTQETIMMGLPVACFDLGAQAEYVRKYEKGIIIPQTECKAAVETLMDYWQGQEVEEVSVSICIPAYNNEAYIRRLLESIRMQTYRDYEVVITDDSSGREVERVVEEYADSMPIRYYRNPSQMGSTRNNNQAISFAEGRYVKIMHHDDWFARPDSLEQLVFLLEEHPEADLAFSGEGRVGNGRCSYEHIKSDRAELLAKDWRNLFLGNWIGEPSVTIFRNKGWLFDENLIWCVDYELYMRILQKNPRFMYTELPLVCIGLSDTQVTRTCQKDRKLMYDEHKYVYKKFNLGKNLRFRWCYIVETIKYKGNRY